MKQLRRTLCIGLMVCLASACGGNSDNSSGGSGGQSQGGNGGDGAGLGGKGGDTTGSQGGSGGIGGNSGGGNGGGTGGNSAGAGGSGGGVVSSGFGNGVYLAVSDSGATALSSDGKTWTTYPPKDAVPYPREVLEACYGDGVVLAIDHASSAQVMQGIWATTDGQSYVRAYPAALTENGFLGHSCGFINGVVSTGNNYSLDKGKTWVESTGVSSEQGFAFGKGVLVSVGSNNISWSSDGKAWTQATIEGGAMPKDISKVAFGGTKFVAVPTNNKVAGARAFESLDGKTWKAAKSTVPGDGEVYYLSSAVKKIFAIGPTETYSLSDAEAPGVGAWVKVGGAEFKDSAIVGDDTIAVSKSRWSTDGVTWMAAAKAASFDYAVRIVKLK